MASDRTASDGACDHDGGKRCPKGTPNCECRLNAEIATLRAERDRYRQGLIDCATQAGADVSDGPPDWPSLEAWAVRAVREMRETFEADL